MKDYYVYIMANRSRTLYTGMTNAIAPRVWEHKHMQTEGFTKGYLIDRLVYYEIAPDAASAILREKQIKGWVRSKKVALIESVNPEWRDLSEDFLDIRPTVSPSPVLVQDPRRRDSSLLKAPAEAGANPGGQSNQSSSRAAQNDGKGAS